MSASKYVSWGPIRPMSRIGWDTLSAAALAPYDPIESTGPVLSALSRRGYISKFEGRYHITNDGVHALEHYMSSDRIRQELTDKQNIRGIGGARERGITSKVFVYTQRSAA